MWYAKFQKRCKALAFCGLVLVFVFSYFLLMDSIPDRIRIVAGREETFDLRVPVTGEVKTDAISVFTNKSPEVEQGKVRIDMADSFTLSSDQEGSFSIDCKLFGLISLKNVTVEVVNKEQVYPGGVPVGIYVKTDGVLAVGTGTVLGTDGLNYEPALHLIKSGDYIKTVNGQVVTEKEELIEQVNKSGGEDVVLGLIRGGEYMQVKVSPVAVGEHSYRIGVWVRDDLAGVGTMTYFTQDMEYGALGHPVSDVDTSVVIQMEEGNLYETRIVGITPGEKGSPGELSGIIDYHKRYLLGTVERNGETGIFGVLKRIPDELVSVPGVEAAMKQEVRTGPATIVSSVSGQRREYSVEITSLDLNSTNVNKGIQLTVTDPKLLSLTGGIVQGMSGSPILQDGKLVGAVTHVFVQDSAKGYGIFIENMLEH